MELFLKECSTHVVMVVFVFFFKDTPTSHCSFTLKLC